MGVSIETPEGTEALTEFVRFYDEVYTPRAIRWPALVPFQLSVLRNRSPFAQGRTMKPFLARADGKIVARVLAVVDHRYIAHWNEPLGHINMFEALPDTRDTVRRLLDHACAWLAEHGLTAARAGFGMLEFPFVIDDYDSLPPSILRQNPPYYHALLKDAGFESEKGAVDYKITASPELASRWQSALAAVRRAGYDVVPLKEVPESERAPRFTQLWNDAFKAHWGNSPFIEAELELLLGRFASPGMIDLTVFAYRGADPVGVLWVAPEATTSAICRPGRTVRPSERLNFLGIGVHESARGRGVNLAMASYAFLDLVRRGATHLSYTLVLDDNWPSRRTAEKLGAAVCANYIAYRRDLRRR
jgi:GNAT superfamily N-acetyltransferase